MLDGVAGERFGCGDSESGGAQEAKSHRGAAGCGEGKRDTQRSGGELSHPAPSPGGGEEDRPCRLPGHRIGIEKGMNLAQSPEEVGDEKEHRGECGDSPGPAQRPRGQALFVVTAPAPSRNQGGKGAGPDEHERRDEGEPPGRGVEVDRKGQVVVVHWATGTTGRMRREAG